LVAFKTIQVESSYAITFTFVSVIGKAFEAKLRTRLKDRKKGCMDAGANFRVFSTGSIDY
jgi:hypothetical protein